MKYNEFTTARDNSITNSYANKINNNTLSLSELKDWIKFNYPHEFKNLDKLTALLNDETKNWNKSFISYYECLFNEAYSL